MATIIKNQTKTKGITYRIQVSVHEKGERKVIPTTYTPPPGLTEKQGYEMAKKFAQEFEDSLKKQQQNQIALPLTIKVRELIPFYLDDLKKHKKATHYASTKKSLSYTEKLLGDYKVMDLNPFIIERDFINEMESWMREITTVQATNLVTAMQEQHMGVTRISRAAFISEATVKKAKSGKNISLCCAKKIAKALDANVNYLFNIEKTEKPFCWATKRSALTALSGLLSYAVKNLIIKENYATAKYVHSFSKTEEDLCGKPVLEDYQIIDYLNHLYTEPDLRMKTSECLAIFMEYRRGEIAGLEWQDFNLETGEIMITRNSVTPAGMGVVETTPKSKASVRQQYMPTQLITIVKEYKVWWDDNVHALGDRYKGSQRLFLQANGTPIWPSTLYQWHTKLLEKYKQPHVTLHSLRKTALSMQKDSHMVKDEEIAQDAGHADFRVTNDHYIVEFQSAKKKVAAVKELLYPAAKS